MRDQLGAITTGLREKERLEIFSDFKDEKLRLAAQIETLAEENKRLDGKNRELKAQFSLD